MLLGRFFYLRFLFVFSLLGHVFAAYSQLPNQVFYDSTSISQEDTAQFSFHWRSLGFTKNNEYFNKIADGYTLFGTQLSPRLIYTVSPMFQIEGGVYYQDDFGNPGIEKLSPTLTLRAKYLGIDVLLGTLEGGLNHKLIEPLYDFERVLNDRIENGLQFKLDKENTFADVWVEWETMIYPGDSLQEEVIAGFSFRKDLGSHWKFPLQVIIYHKGGQIDRSPAPLLTTGNFSTGVIRNDKFSGFLKELENSFYFVFHNDFSRSGVMEYGFGKGFYINSSLYFGKGFYTMLSYWHGETFDSVYGGQLYQSVSSTYKYANQREPLRQLLILRIMHDVEIGKGIVLSTRIEPFYDFVSGNVEFSNALYLQYNELFKLKK